MNTGNLLSNVGVALTLLLGLLAIGKPQVVARFVSIKAVGFEGLSEIRATYGGFFAGIAILAIITQSTAVFLTVGIGWLGAAMARLASLYKGTITPKNIGGVIFESAIGTCCCAVAIF